MFEVVVDDLTNAQTQALIAFHLAGMNENVPPGATFLGLSDLQRPEVTVWSAWENAKIASVGALKLLPDGTGEIKSMRTHPDFAGRGAGGIILRTIITAAKSQGLRRLSLETGSGSAFEAALALYQKHGFKKGEAYSTHEQTSFNHFLHLDLT
ncbi:MAG: GNAT family N-acetyltransferase [Rhizobiaceae bacterium]|nr:GNAT family N-acetyltransferase [Rhizobiaceae bacterium]